MMTNLKNNAEKFKLKSILYNPEEHKYPLEYQKYLKMRNTDIDKLINFKVNCFGNFGISLFWEEKIILFIRYVQLLSLVYIAFIEYWPEDFDKNYGNLFVLMGFNFIYYDEGYYDLIVEDDRYFYNVAAWVLLSIFLCGLASLVLLSK